LFQYASFSVGTLLFQHLQCLHTPSVYKHCYRGTLDAVDNKTVVGKLINLRCRLRKVISIS